MLRFLFLVAHVLYILFHFFFAILIGQEWLEGVKLILSCSNNLLSFIGTGGVGEEEGTAQNGCKEDRVFALHVGDYSERKPGQDAT